MLSSESNGRSRRAAKTRPSKTGPILGKIVKTSGRAVFGLSTNSGKGAVVMLLGVRPTIAMARARKIASHASKPRAAGVQPQSGGREEVSTIDLSRSGAIRPPLNTRTLS
jgi:hypothetical protein